MWAEGGKLHFHKALVSDAESFIAFYRKNIEGRDAFGANLDGGGGRDSAHYEFDADFGGNRHIIVNLVAGTIRDGFGQTETTAVIGNPLAADKVTVNVVETVPESPSTTGVASATDTLSCHPSWMTSKSLASTLWTPSTPLTTASTRTASLGGKRPELSARRTKA